MASGMPTTAAKPAVWKFSLCMHLINAHVDECAYQIDPAAGWAVLVHIDILVIYT